MIEIVITSIIAFASTNLDDIFILMLFFANKNYKTTQVVIGQYLGIIALIAVSLVVSLVGMIIDQMYVGLFGLLPVYFGIRGIIRLMQHQKVSEQEELSLNKGKSNNIFYVASVTFANGGDNIGIYIPLFSTLLVHQRVVMISLFLMMVALWCFIARYLSKHPAIAKTIDNYGHIVTPVILLLLGFYILYESGSFRLFPNNIRE